MNRTIGDLEYNLRKSDIENREQMEADLEDRWKKVSEYYNQKRLSEWTLTELLYERAAADDDFILAEQNNDIKLIYEFDIQRIALAYEIMRRKINTTSSSAPE